MARPKTEPNYIRINKFKNRLDYFLISSKHDVLNNEYVTIDIRPEYIKISVATIDCENNIRKPSKVFGDGSWMNFGIGSSLLKEGYFLIDEDESTEDEIIVYFEDIFEQ